MRGWAREEPAKNMGQMVVHGRTRMPMRARTHTHEGGWGHGGGTGVSRLFIYTVLSESTELKTGWG